MHNDKNGREKRIGKMGLQLAALGIALSVFATATVFGADSLDKTAVYAMADPYAGITQEGELGIAQLSSQEDEPYTEESAEESETESQAESSEPSKEISEREESSKAESSKVSSRPSSSNVTSSKPSSSAESSKSSSSTASSKPVSSAVSSAAESSKPVSSKPASSQESSETAAESSEETDPEEELIYIIAGAVQREIVGTGSVPQARYYEAYKAQAVACRSYMEYQKKYTGSYPKMSFATPHAKTIELVRSVYNQVATYNGSAINAVYHADAGGKTQSSQYVWGGTIAYLKAADSPYDVVTDTYTISAESCKSKLETIGIEVTGEPETWFDLESATYTDGDFVYEMKVCGQKVKARTLREQVFGSNNLQSTKITSITVKDGKITFSTKGYGHGVGMSQRGALGYSAAGWTYTQILKNYYKGISIKTW